MINNMANTDETIFNNGNYFYSEKIGTKPTLKKSHSDNAFFTNYLVKQNNNNDIANRKKKSYKKYFTCERIDQAKRIENTETYDLSNVKNIHNNIVQNEDEEQSYYHKTQNEITNIGHDGTVTATIPSLKQHSSEEHPKITEVVQKVKNEQEKKTEPKLNESLINSEHSKSKMKSISSKSKIYSDKFQITYDFGCRDTWDISQSSDSDIIDNDSDTQYNPKNFKRDISNEYMNNKYENIHQRAENSDNETENQNGCKNDPKFYNINNNNNNGDGNDNNNNSDNTTFGHIKRKCTLIKLNGEKKKIDMDKAPEIINFIPYNTFAINKSINQKGNNIENISSLPLSIQDLNDFPTLSEKKNWDLVKKCAAASKREIHHISHSQNIVLPKIKLPVHGQWRNISDVSNQYIYSGNKYIEMSRSVTENPVGYFASKYDENKNSYSVLENKENSENKNIAQKEYSARYITCEAENYYETPQGLAKYAGVNNNLMKFQLLNTHRECSFTSSETKLIKSVIKPNIHSIKETLTPLVAKHSENMILSKLKNVKSKTNTIRHKSEMLFSKLLETGKNLATWTNLKNDEQAEKSQNIHTRNISAAPPSCDKIREQANSDGNEKQCEDKLISLYGKEKTMPETKQGMTTVKLDGCCLLRKPGYVGNYLCRTNSSVTEEGKHAENKNEKNKTKEKEKEINEQGYQSTIHYSHEGKQNVTPLNTPRQDTLTKQKNKYIQKNGTMEKSQQAESNLHNDLYNIMYASPTMNLDLQYINIIFNEILKDDQIKKKNCKEQFDCVNNTTDKLSYTDDGFNNYNKQKLPNNALFTKNESYPLSNDFIETEQIYQSFTPIQDTFRDFCEFNSINTANTPLFSNACSYQNGVASNNNNTRDDKKYMNTQNCLMRNKHVTIKTPLNLHHEYGELQKYAINEEQLHYIKNYYEPNVPSNAVKGTTALNHNDIHKYEYKTNNSSFKITEKNGNSKKLITNLPNTKYNYVTLGRKFNKMDAIYKDAASFYDVTNSCNESIITENSRDISALKTNPQYRFNYNITNNVNANKNYMNEDLATNYATHKNKNSLEDITGSAVRNKKDIQKKINYNYLTNKYTKQTICFNGKCGSTFHKHNGLNTFKEERKNVMHINHMYP